MPTAEPKPRKITLIDSLLIATLPVFLLWMAYVGETYFGINWKGRKIAPGQGMIPLWLAIVATPAIYVGVWIFLRREIAFLARAVSVTGRVSSIGTIQMKGLRDISYSYTFGPIGSVTYQSKRSVSSSLLQELSPGDDLAILVDPLNPSVSRLAGE